MRFFATRQTESGTPYYPSLSPAVRGGGHAAAGRRGRSAASTARPRAAPTCEAASTRLPNATPRPRAPCRAPPSRSRAKGPASFTPAFGIEAARCLHGGDGHDRRREVRLQSNAVPPAWRGHRFAFRGARVLQRDALRSRP